MGAQPTVWLVAGPNGVGNNAATPRAVAEGRAGCIAFVQELGALPPALAATLERLPACPEA